MIRPPCAGKKNGGARVTPNFVRLLVAHISDKTQRIKSGVILAPSLRRQKKRRRANYRPCRSHFPQNPEDKIWCDSRALIAQAKKTEAEANELHQILSAFLLLKFTTKTQRTKSGVIRKPSLHKQIRRRANHQILSAFL